MRPKYGEGRKNLKDDEKFIADLEHERIHMKIYAQVSLNPLHRQQTEEKIFNPSSCRHFRMGKFKITLHMK